MCGIVALFSKKDLVNEVDLKRATFSLSHRGPDIQKTWIGKSGKVGLGHARLSIVDLVTGDQPIVNGNKQLAIVVNGEFYDYKRIQKELKNRGCLLQTRSDSEIALHLYAEKGVNCLEDLRGEFALIIWDEQKQRLFAARDRFGIKPLYYAIDEDYIYIGSEVKAIFGAGMRANWDEDSYYQHLFFYKHIDRTLFDRVYQVPPGYYMIVSTEGIQLKQYWDHNYPRIEECSSKRNIKEDIERVHHALNESIRIRLKADVPIGFHLSGGVDSSAVLGIAAKYQTERLQAFTVTFSEEAYDEGKIARETAKYVGADFYPLRLNFTDFADHVTKAVWHAETIGINMNGVARYLKSKVLHERGLKVVLTGDGADEIFAGYIFSRIDLFLDHIEGLDKETKKLKLEEFLQLNPSFNHIPIKSYLDYPLDPYEKQIGFSPTWIQAVAVSRDPFKSLLSTEYLTRLQGKDPHQDFLDRLDIKGQITGRDRIKQGMYLWNKSILPNQIMFAERLDMSHGVEVRMPLLDHKLFELVRDYPVSMLIKNYKEKYVLREAAKPYLTKKVYSRPKQPFLAPPSTLQTNNKLFQLIQDTLRSKTLARIPFFNQKKLVELLDKLPKMNKQERVLANPILLLVLTTCILQERLLDSASLRGEKLHG